LAALAFDQTGMLLAATSIDGQVINVFTLAPNASRVGGGGGFPARADSYVTPRHVCVVTLTLPLFLRGGGVSAADWGRDLGARTP
jgi:hypothetical protein